MSAFGWRVCSSARVGLDRAPPIAHRLVLLLPGGMSTSTADSEVRAAFRAMLSAERAGYKLAVASNPRLSEPAKRQRKAGLTTLHTILESKDGNRVQKLSSFFTNLIRDYSEAGCVQEASLLTQLWTTKFPQGRKFSWAPIGAVQLGPRRKPRRTPSIL